MRSNAVILGLFVLAVALGLGSVANAQVELDRDSGCCEEIIEDSWVVWTGTDTLITFERFASYCAPILWFSPDEPLLRGIKDPKDINIPMAFPFEDSSAAPVVYYRVRNIITIDQGNSFSTDSTDINSSIIDISRVSAVDLDFFFYYPSEEGLGGHNHDVESVEMKIAVYRQPNCGECRYGLIVVLATAKAHGILWYDNTLKTDADTHFPLHILVEEGKHASCTDKNGDGAFTPGYDVSERVNDAWGVRDVMRTGALFGGGFQSWYAKNRKPEQRVFPPLPEDSRVREQYMLNGEYAAGHPVYSVRPFPSVETALAAGDPSIIRFVDKGYHNWPGEEEDTGLNDLEDWLDPDTFMKSLSIAFRYDNAAGVSFVFPLFIFKNFNDPVTGGWLVNRVYFKDTNLRDFSWNILYTSSASRWLDGYFAAGIEYDVEDDGLGGQTKDTRFMSETGVKFRFNVAHSPVSFLKSITDFWGVRFGVRYVGFDSFHDIGYAVEIGAGTF